MTILVTDANGMFGNEIQIVVKRGNDKFIFTDVCDGHEKLDITTLDAVRKAVKETFGINIPYWIDSLKKVY